MTKHIRKVRKGFQPKPEVVLAVLLMALEKYNFIMVSDYEELAILLRLVACQNKYKNFPCHAPVDLGYFKSSWKKLERFEFPKRKIATPETDGYMHIFYY